MRGNEAQCSQQLSGPMFSVKLQTAGSEHRCCTEVTKGQSYDKALVQHRVFQFMQISILRLPSPLVAERLSSDPFAVYEILEFEA